MRFLLTMLLVFVAYHRMPAQQLESQPTDDETGCSSIVGKVEHPEALTDCCRFVVSLRQHLPNVICDQSTARYTRARPDSLRLYLQDRVTAHVIYEDGREGHSDIKIDGQPQDKQLSEVKGQYSFGEFGTDLIFVFDGGNHPNFRFLRTAKLEKQSAFVFDAIVSGGNNHGWVLQSNKLTTYPEFRAEIWLDQTTHNLLRFKVMPLPDPDFPVSNIELDTRYENIQLGDGTEFVLPVKSESSSCLWNYPKRTMAFCNYSLMTFKNCHKFRAKSRIITDGVDGSN